MIDKFILQGHEPVEEPDLLKWGAWFENADNRCVARTDVGKAWVSTVFLGIDHQFGEGPPLLFESMAFGTDEEFCERYATWDEAEAGHKAMVERVRATLADVPAIVKE